jgi:glycosyltransferase involved in cell wall biosynthesis
MARVCMVALNDYTSDPRVRRQAEALIERGDAVDCICVCHEDIRSLRGVRLFRISRAKYRGVNRLWLILKYIQFFCYAFFKVSIEHLRSPYDIVQVHTMPDFLIFTASIPKLLGAKLVLDVHDLMPEIYMTKYGVGQKNWMVRLMGWLERRSVAFADRAIAVHKPHLDVLVEHGNPRRKFSVVLNVPDHRIFTHRSVFPRPDGDFRLIYHGTLPKRAGLDVAIRAVARARKDIPNLHFLIMGAGDSVNALMQLTTDLGLTECIEFMPSMPVERLPDMISKSHVGIVPYRADPFTRYVLPTKLLEYAAIGIPAITSRLSTVEAYFDRTMVAYFEPGNEVELAAQIVRLYRDPALRASLAAQAERFSQTYNWPAERQVYYSLIDSLLKVPGSLC